MSTKTFKGFLHYEKEDWMLEPAYHWFSCDMSEHGYVLIGPHEFSAEVPDDFNPVPAQIAALEKKQAQLRKKFADEMMNLDRKIGELQAIGFSPEVPQ